jgi:hypothetical protein
MGGFFLDSLIRLVVKELRRDHRATTAAEWPLVDASIVPSSGSESSRSGVTYSYIVNGETWYGSCIGNPFRDAATGGAIEPLRVRYNPTDPADSRVLNIDNPNLPFQIDHDPY